MLCHSKSILQLSAQNAPTKNVQPGKLPSRLIDDVQDLTGVRRSRTPSSKRKQMEDWSDAGPSNKRKVTKIEAGVKPSAGPSSLPMKAGGPAGRPKPKRKVNKAKEHLPDPNVEYGDLTRSSRTMAGRATQSID